MNGNQFRGRVDDKTELDRTVDDFRKAWDLRTAVPLTEKTLFAKALYGWVLALHNRSLIELDAHHKRIGPPTHTAQDKFSEFPSQVHAAGNANPTSFPNICDEPRRTCGIRTPQFADQLIVESQRQ